MPEKHLRALCAHLSLPLPEIEANGLYTLRLGDGSALGLRGSRKDLHFEGRVCALPAEVNNAEDLCRELLLLSLGRAGQECARFMPHLALRDGELFLQMRIQRDTGDGDFADAVEYFANLLEKWSELATGQQRRRAPHNAMMPGFLAP